MIGTTLAHYRITAALGAGGMGEVWRATDTRLGREVALKALPEDFAADPDRHARFEREAKLLASLNHPNIATLYGLEHLGGNHVLVMELVEGEGLDEVIARGPVPVDEAVSIARQIAEALEAAHDAGIVHRDLKPANVRIRPDGTVKVLDFGLAKAWDAPTGDSGLSLSPTLTHHATAAGVLLGTAAYMSPEQARGRPVDKRADIWAFGAVLWEMLTGRPLFEGETVSDVLAAVLTREVDHGALPEATPPSIRALLHRCLERNPKNRLHDIADARIVIDEVLSGRSEPAATASTATRAPTRTPWLIAGASVVVAALAILLARPALWSGPVAQPVLRFQFVPPQGERLEQNSSAGQRGFAISPDGSKLVYVVEKGATTELRLRSLDSEVATRIPGTDGAQAPFFSPDGKWVGFAAGPKLEKVALAGGAPIVLADAPFIRGAVWADDGSILFVPNQYVPVSRIPAAGGAVQAVTTIRTDEGELQHRWPELLPGGKVLLYAVGYGEDWDEATIVAERIESGERKVLVRGGTSPRFLPTGQLVYARAGGLYAVGLDVQSLAVSGPPVEVARNVFVSPLGVAEVDVSRTGILVSAPADVSGAAYILSWVDRNGRSEPLKVAAAGYNFVSLSPSNDRAALNIGNGISILDLKRLSLSRLTLARRAEIPTWSSDGRRLYFGYEQGTNYQVFSKATDDSGEPELVIPADATEDPYASSRDGSHLLTLRFPLDGSNEFLIHDLSHPQDPPQKLLQSSLLDWENAGFSPDDRWLVYQSRESGRPEIYVRPASGEDRKWQVSVDGGTAPVWSPAGNEIFFLAGPQLLAAPVSAQGDEIVVGEPKVLFENHRILVFDVARDGKRFLVVEDPNPGAQTRLDVVVNWFAEVQRRVEEARTP